MALARLPWLAGAGLGLAVGVWGGLARLGWVVPPLLPHHMTAHGPLMIGGFLGALIGLERALAVGRWWGYLAPAFAVAGTLWMALRPETRPAALLLAAAGLALVTVYTELWRRRSDLATAVMAIGAGLWLAGNLLWAASGLVLSAVPFWSGFLVLTILGERLELSRVLAPPPRATGLFVLCLALTLGGLFGSFVDHGLGIRAFGAGLVALAFWSLRWDLARRTVRHPGRHRFTAICLLGGYLWLLVSGAMMLLWGNRLGGLTWDAAVHALFFGFVFSMIFGHAPLVAKAVLDRELAFSPVFYAHLALLHASLVLRVVADVLGSPDGRAWGAALGAAAIAVFLANTVRAALRSPR